MRTQKYIKQTLMMTTLAATVMMSGCKRPYFIYEYIEAMQKEFGIPVVASTLDNDECLKNQFGALYESYITLPNQAGQDVKDKVSHLKRIVFKTTELVQATQERVLIIYGAGTSLSYSRVVGSSGDGASTRATAILQNNTLTIQTKKAAVVKTGWVYEVDEPLYYKLSNVENMDDAHDIIRSNMDFVSSAEKYFHEDPTCGEYIQIGDVL